MLFLGGVITDQAEADEDTSLKERVAITVGKLFYTHEPSLWNHNLIVYYSTSYILFVDTIHSACS